MTAIPLSDITIDPTIQIREQLHEGAVERYMDAFDELPPIVVYQTPEELLLSDGMHRLEAAKRLGRKDIQAEVRVGSRADAEEHAITANTKNAMPLTANERDEGIRRLRVLHPKWGYQRIGRAMSLPERTILRIIRGQKGKAQIDPSVTEGLSRSHFEELALSQAPVGLHQPLAEAAVAQGWNSVELRKVAKEIADPSVSDETKRRVLADLSKPGQNGEATIAPELIGAILQEARGFSAKPQIRAFIGAAHSLLDHLKRDAEPLAGMSPADLHRLFLDIDAAQQAVDKLRLLVAGEAVLV